MWEHVLRYNNNIFVRVPRGHISKTHTCARVFNLWHYLKCSLSLKHTHTYIHESNHPSIHTYIRGIQQYKNVMKWNAGFAHINYNHGKYTSTQNRKFWTVKSNMNCIVNDVVYRIMYTRFWVLCGPDLKPQKQSDIA